MYFVINDHKNLLIMKNILFSLLLSIISFFAFSQDKVGVFSSRNMVFYGLDFTEARFTGGSGLTSPTAMQDKYMPGLNELMIFERKRYDVAKSYQKSNVEYYFDLTDKFNSKTDIYNQYVYKDVEVLSDEQVLTAVKKFKDPKHHGLGLVYIVDEVNHYRNVISVHITFFDIDSGEMLFSRRARGEMKGFSIRNYYAGGIRQIIKDSEDSYNRWKNE